MRNLGVYLVANTASCTRHRTVEVIQAAVQAGVQWIQLRAKEESAREFYELALAAGQLTAGRAELLVNDRVDVYLAARAAGAAVTGVHIGQQDLPVQRVRELIGDATLGLSASTDEQLAAANANASMIDYLGVGAVRATPTKKDHPTPIEIEGFARARKIAQLPCVAIGALQAEDAPALRAAGAEGMAVVRAICSSTDPGAAAGGLLRAWQEAK